ncbi:MAG: DUF2490 domain-containing protein [Bacteroidales bacterium]|nr:DUF2490 domain-containing protein [Bacteroidales bacterium]
MKRFTLIVLACLSGILVSAQTKSFQVWTGIGVSYELSKKLSFDFETETRFQQASKTLKQAAVSVGARYAITKPIYVGVSYEFADKYKKNGYFPVNTFVANLGYKRKLGDFRLGIQTKLTVEKNSYIKNPEDIYPEWKQKNKIKLGYAKYKRIKPSIAVETYHPLEAGANYRISTVKYSANCTLGFRKGIDFTAGYMFRHEIDKCEYISICTLGLSKSF